MIFSVASTSIGKKIIMAVTGLMLLGFVLGHLAGNLLIFSGQDALNAYALKLRHLGPLLWIARITLLGAVIAHILVAIRLTLDNREARPMGYIHRSPNNETTYAAKTMMISGLLVLAFIVYHLMHYTWRLTNPEISHLTDSLGRHDVYSMVVLSFQMPAISITYVIAIFLLSTHLSHGLSSTPQTLGLNNERTLALFKKVGLIISLLIFVGYASIPLAVLFGRITTAGVAA